jgi:hypothetical protein
LCLERFTSAWTFVEGGIPLKTFGLAAYVVVTAEPDDATEESFSRQGSRCSLRHSEKSAVVGISC